MGKIYSTIQVINKLEMEKIHEYSLRCLQNIGMKIMVYDFLEALDKAGAYVDYASNIVRFPPNLVNQAIQMSRKENSSEDSNNEEKIHPFSWHTFSRDIAEEPRCSFGGACLNFFDYEAKCVREATVNDMVNMVKLGETLPEIATVGNPVICMMDEKGLEIDSRIRTVLGASILAKYTSKPEECEVWTEKELEYIIEIGVVLRGSWEKYKKRPMLISPKDTVSPLLLTQDAGRILLALAKRGLPCTIIPVPIAAATSPVTPAGGIVISNAEILGVMTAIKAYNPDTPVCGGAISGVLNMATISVNYSAPEAILMDLGLAQLYRRFYKLNCGVGAGYIDAKYPSTQSGIDSVFKTLCSVFGGNITYPAGLLDAGKMFCPEQAMIDIEIAKSINKFMNGIEINDDTIAFNVIQDIGICGSFISSDHTLDNYKSNWIPKLFDRAPLTSRDCLSDDKIVKDAHEKWRDIVSTSKGFAIEDKKVEEIDRIVARAKRDLLK